MAGFFKRVLQQVYEALQAGGALHVPGPWISPWPPWPPPGPTEPPWPPAGEPARLDEPPAGHPERLCPGTALTPAERALDRELNGDP